jgi:NADPH2:quinone reductase
MRAMQITRLGGPDVFEEINAPTPHVGPEDILIRHEAVGLNFIDIYRRTGVYPIALPAILGSEAAGTVTAIGAAVTRFKVGDHVGYASGLGAYAEEGVVPAAQAVKVPAGVSSRTAAAVLLKGMTAEFLTRIWPLDPGDPVLVHAAAGGVGVILTQWLKHLGCTVIATVGTPEKAETARANGCEHVILYDREDVAKTVRRSRRKSCLRFGRRSNLRGEFAQHRQARVIRQLRQCLGSRSRLRAPSLSAGRIDIFNPADAVRLHRQR